MKHRVEGPTKNGNCSAKDVVKAREKNARSGPPRWPLFATGIWQKVTERGGEQRRRCHVRHRFKENVAMVQIAGTQERWSTHSLTRSHLAEFAMVDGKTDGWMDATDREEKRRGGGRRAMTDGRGRVLDQLLLMAPSSRSTTQR